MARGVNLKKGSIFQGYKILEKLPSETKYRQMFLCKEGVLIIYDNFKTPASFMSDKGRNPMPKEYVAMRDCIGLEMFSGLPRLLNFGYDLERTWMLVEKLVGTTIRDYISSFHKDNTSVEKIETLISMSSWLLSYSHIWKTFMLDGVSLNLTPDNLIIVNDSEGMPDLKIRDLHSALSLEYGLKSALMSNLHSRYLPPEVLCGTFDEKSFTYVIAMLIVFCLVGKFPDEELVDGKIYEDMVFVLARKENYLMKVRISEDRKNALLASLDSNPSRRPSCEGLIEMWETDTYISYEEAECAEKYTDIENKTSVEDIYTMFNPRRKKLPCS